MDAIRLRPGHRARPVRTALALAAAAVAGAVGALILGEYPFEGLSVLASGLVFGLFIAEAAMAVDHGGGLVLGLGCGVVAGVSMAAAAWITTFHDLSFLGPAGWAAIGLTAAAAGVRAGLRRGPSAAADGSPGPVPAPAGSPEDPSS